GTCRVTGPVAGVAATTYSIAAAIQHAAQESETARHAHATGRRSSSRAHTVTTASAIPIANQTKNRGSHRPISGWRPWTNMAAGQGNDGAPYTPRAIRRRLARTPTSAVLFRRANQPRAAAVNGSETYQAISTTGLHICPRCAGPSALSHHMSGT